MAERFRSLERLESSAATLAVGGNIKAEGISYSCAIPFLAPKPSSAPAPSLRLGVNLNVEPITAGVYGSAVAPPSFMKHVDHFFRPDT